MTNLWSCYLCGLLQVPNGVLIKNWGKREETKKKKKGRQEGGREEEREWMKGRGREGGREEGRRHARTKSIPGNLIVPSLQMIKLRSTKAIMIPNIQMYLWCVYLSGSAPSSPTTHSLIIDVDWWISPGTYYLEPPHWYTKGGRVAGTQHETARGPVYSK